MMDNIAHPVDSIQASVRNDHLALAARSGHFHGNHPVGFGFQGIPYNSYFVEHCVAPEKDIRGHAEFCPRRAAAPHTYWRHPAFTKTNV
jgi:hypothetical protein